jgi:hypothetical protein
MYNVHDELWLKVIEILTPLTGMANIALAAVTQWSFAKRHRDFYFENGV